MSAYYPEGAAHLPWAPWNQDDDDFDGLDEFVDDEPDYDAIRDAQRDEREGL